NLSYGKLSRFVEQDLSYTVELDGAARPVRSELGVDERNTYRPGAGLPGYPPGYYRGARWDPIARRLDAREGYYGGYTRLYLPAGSRLLDAAGFDDRVDVGAESGRAVVGGYVGLEMGAGRRLAAEWVPAGTPSAPGEYRLVVQRQPGAPDRALTVRVRLPEGYAAEAVAPAPNEVQDGVVTWRVTLDRDRTVRLRLRPTAGSDQGEDCGLKTG